MKTKTRFVLLGLLQEEQLTGYELKKIIDRRMSFLGKDSYGQIYPELKLLMEEGCIKEVKPTENKATGREKIKYTITDKS